MGPSALTGTVVERGREALEKLWSGVSGQVERTIESLAPDTAVVHVRCQYPEPYGVHHDVFVVVNENGTWLIRIHKCVD
jgi:hypothetical protein